MAAAILLSAATAFAAVEAPVGVLLAPAGDRLTELEARFADAVIAELVASGARASLLHEASPLVRASRARLPAVSAEDDWTPLTDVLSRLAARLRLGYVLLVAVNEDGGVMHVNGMLVVRGGASAELRASAAAADEGLREAAGAAARRVMELAAELPAPADPAEQAVAVPGPAPGPTRQQSAEPDAEGEERPPGQETESATGEAPGTAEAVEVTEKPQPTEDQPAAEAVPDEGAADALAQVQAALEAGELDRAGRLLRDFKDAHQPAGRFYLLRARLSMARQQRDDAIADLRQAVALQPDLVEARVRLARLLDDSGLWQDAITHYQEALAVEPNRLEALLGLARIYRDHGHRRKAVELLTEAADAGVKDPAVLTLLGELQALEDRPELAERYYLQAVAATSGERAATILERLGDLYADLHRHREALSCYLKAAELNPSRASMVQRRYREVMSAADNSVYEALTSSWSAFEDYVQNGIGEREMVYRKLADMRTQLEEAMRFADGVTPPADQRPAHAGRQYAYSLAVEAAVAALTYLDLGEGPMRERAERRHREALAELNALRGAEGG
ncbi:MAG: tetratricopeptide repeat protein [Armatimonadota bacterium]|nr:tetratricopeptide repeat protein [Armatimonadota bacterium]